MKIGQKTEERGYSGVHAIAEMVSIWATQCTIVECELRGICHSLRSDFFRATSHGLMDDEERDQREQPYKDKQ